MRPEKSPRKIPLPLLVLPALAAGLTLLWWSTREEEGSVEKKRGTGAPASAGQVPLFSKSAATAPLPPRGSPEFNEALLLRCAPWLASRGRDAASLVALWDLAGDESLLLEAAEKFPDDPRVGVAMIDYLYQKGEDALPWAERLIRNEPDNPAGHYWKALLTAYTRESLLLKRDGKPMEEALDALRAGAVAGGRPDPHLRDRLLTRREAMLAGGASPREAARAALTATGPTPPALYMMNGQTMSVITGALAAAKAEGNTARLEEIAALGVSMGEHLGHITAPRLIDDILRNALIERSLKELPPDTEYGDTGKTAGERLAEVEAARAEMDTLKSLWAAGESIMDTLTDSQASEFTDRVLLHGEAAAYRWLSESIAKSGAAPQNGGL